MGNFGGDRYRGNGNRGNSRGGGFRSRGNDDYKPTMHDAVCSSCGKDCQVPFRPTGEKPVYCRDCFQKEDSDSSSRPRTKSFQETLGRRRMETRLYHSEPEPTASKKDIKELREKLEEISSKLDNLLDRLYEKV